MDANKVINAFENNYYSKNDDVITGRFFEKNEI
jgi:hypothetical protein